MTDAGKVCFVYKGEYSASETYEFLDYVVYNKCIFVAKQLTQGNDPVLGVDDPYWQIMVAIPDPSEFIVDIDEKSIILNDEGQLTVNKNEIPWEE